jgi:hypothetical protein
MKCAQSISLLLIIDPVREPITQQTAEAEHVIRCYSGVGVMLDDAITAPFVIDRPMNRQSSRSIWNSVSSRR